MIHIVLFQKKKKKNPKFKGENCILVYIFVQIFMSLNAGFDNCHSRQT